MKVKRSLTPRRKKLKKKSSSNMIYILLFLIFFATLSMSKNYSKEELNNQNISIIFNLGIFCSSVFLAITLIKVLDLIK